MLLNKCAVTFDTAHNDHELFYVIAVSLLKIRSEG